MGNFLKEKYKDIKASSLLKSIDAKDDYDDIINFSIGDPNIDVEESLLMNAVNDVIDNKLTHYADARGYIDLRKLISDVSFGEYGVRFETNEILVTSGATIGMFIVLHSILDIGDEVIILEPYYPTYTKQIQMCGGVVVSVVLENFYLDIDKISKAITNKTKAIIINSPNNPTGCIYDFKSLNELKNLVVNTNILVISDEIYTFYHYSKKIESFYNILKDNCIIIRSCSKDYTMPGMRIGYILGDKNLIHCFDIVNESIHYCASAYAQRLAYQVLLNKDRIHKANNDEYIKRMNYAYKRINAYKNLRVNYPDGGIYMFVDITNTKYSSLEFQSLLLKETHVLVVPGSAFGKNFDRYVRFAITQTIENMEIAFKRIDKAIKEGRLNV